METITRLNAIRKFSDCTNSKDGKLVSNLWSDIMTLAVDDSVKPDISFKAIQRVMPIMYPTLNTLRRRYTDIHNVIIAKYDKHTPITNESYKILRMSEEDKKEVEATQMKHLEEDLDEPIEINMQQVTDFFKNKNNDSWEDNVIEFQLLTGSRIAECFNPETMYEPLGKQLRVTGLMKTRGNEDAEAIRDLWRSTPAAILKLRKRLLEYAKTRNMIGHDGNLISSVASEVNKRIKTVFPGLTSHDLRGLYTAIVWKKLYPKQDRRHIVKKLLGHMGDIASKSYVRIHLSSGKNCKMVCK